MGFSRQEYWSGLPFPSTGDLPDQESNCGLLHCSHILYQLSCEGSPNKLSCATQLWVLRLQSCVTEIFVITVLYSCNTCRRTSSYEAWQMCLPLKKKKIKCTSISMLSSSMQCWKVWMRMYLKLLLSIRHHHLSKLYFYLSSITGTMSRLLLLFLSWSSAVMPGVKLTLGDLSLQ